MRQDRRASALAGAGALATPALVLSGVSGIRGRRGLVLVVDRHHDDATASDERARWRVLSLGAGVQSTTVLLMSIAGELPRLDAAIFADTGWEPQTVYRHLWRLAGECAAAGLPLYVVSAGNLRNDALDPGHRFASMPLFVRRPDGRRGRMRRQCTSEYKIRPIHRQLRALLGFRPGERVRGVVVERWLGISLDEVQRMRDSREPWAVNVYPLVERRMTRHDCHRWLARHGWRAPRSSCIGCPFHSDARWREIKSNPSEWEDAVAFDEAIRRGHPSVDGATPLLGNAYLHASLRPLAKADLSTPEERGQQSLFGQDCTGLCGT